MVDVVFTIPLPGQTQERNTALPQGLNRGGPLGEFIAGPENRLAVAVICALLGTHDRRMHSLAKSGPLVLCGASGTGKSHLAATLAQVTQQHNPAAVVSHLLAAEYAREFAHAVETRTVSEWEARYRRCDLLIVEDLDHLAEKHGAQEHLARTIDRLLDKGGWIVITSSAHPAGMRHLAASLRSRLSAGLAMPINRPGKAAREAILRRLAESHQLKITPEGLSTLANSVEGTVRDLMGITALLATIARQEQSEYDRPKLLGVAEVADCLLRRRQSATPTVAGIALRTAKYFSVRLNELRGPGRRRNLALARKVAMYLARHLTRQSYERIGEYFGRRDHTTVMYACNRVAELLEGDPATGRAIEDLRGDLMC